jgi:hypothetical protein
MLNSVCVLMSLFLITLSTIAIASCTFVTDDARLAVTMLFSSLYRNSLLFPNGAVHSTSSCCSDNVTPTCFPLVPYSCKRAFTWRTLLKPCFISSALKLFFLPLSITSNAAKKLSNLERAAELR